MKNTSLSSKLAQLMILLVLSPHTWPGSLCDTMKSCCYPTTGKPPADFRIHGLWPNNADGTYLSSTNPRTLSTSPSDLMTRMVSDWPTLACPSSNGRRFWKHDDGAELFNVSALYNVRVLNKWAICPLCFGEPTIFPLARCILSSR
ncbi:unnamed protein product [Spirodela intermedia]|uniref:Uncharacterized protein n=1 Tax=Spirodela intermedia TaxID=51605 RepID=A0A7I8IPS5_SPIIN|nr:unnamed protein product [Spirodela intermedia]CAA6659781.1 unnamed protein product [Spirodela intermedia]